MVLGELEEPLPLLGRQRVAGGVLEVRDDVGKLGPRSGREHALKRGDVDPVGLELDHPHVGAAVAQRQQRPIVRGPLDDHGVAGLDQRVEQERVSLHRPIRDHDLLGSDLVALGDPCAQRRVANRRPVRGHPTGIGLERLVGRGAQAVHVDDVERRRAPGK